jgi:hypothetical protein
MLVLLSSAFGVIFAAHQWPRQVDGYGFSPEIAVAVAQEARSPSVK